MKSSGSNIYSLGALVLTGVNRLFRVRTTTASLAEDQPSLENPVSSVSSGDPISSGNPVSSENQTQVVETIMNEPEPTRMMTREELAASIASATSEVFMTMLDLEISEGQMEDDNPSAASRASGVVALLGLAGEWVGNGRICCTPDFGCKMASQLLMQDFSGVNEEVLDAIGEVANMIIGNVKNALEDRLGTLSLSTPTVIYGHNFEARSVGIRQRVTLNFNSGSEQLQVQISISPATTKRPATRAHAYEAVPALV